MDRVPIFLCCFFLCLYATSNAAEAQETPSLPVATIPTQPPDTSLLQNEGTVKPLSGQLLKDIKCSKSSFNPSLKDIVELSFSLVKPSKVTIRVYDPDHELIKTLADENQMTSDTQKINWDGKDNEGSIVPDEAYFFSIIAKDNFGKEEIYDPTMFSGGIEDDITFADIDRESHTVTYTMPKMGRVLIRIGIQGGPLMNTLVDWQPRVKGLITEYWNGKDKDNLVDICGHPKFKMIISYFSLPENSIIAFGNKNINYLDYKKTEAVGRYLKPERASSVQKVSHHYKLKRTEDYSPEVQMTLVNSKGISENGTTILSKKTLVKVELAKQDKLIFQNQQFEIVFFLNYEFYAEDEAGYTPFNWVWDLSNVEEGEHLLTVNLSSFKDQIGVLSRKVKVVKE